MKRLSVVFSGLLFGAGLVVAEMTRTSKVLGFLDVFGSWDPSLLFVMAGAIAVHSLSYRLIRKRASPLFGGRFFVPAPKSVDQKLVLGALLFGLGWGLGGFCPGPALTSLVTLSVDSLVFTLSMLSGMLLFQRYGALFESRAKSHDGESGSLPPTPATF